jgi:hypothetical protein
MSKMKWAIGTALLALSAGAFAADTAGTYMTFNRSVSESAMPDGNRARVMHYYHAGTSDKADSPFAGKTSECIGRMIVSSAGKVVSGSGFCFAQDAAGNGGSWSWKVEEAGTGKCPSICGTFKWMEGYGNARKATASGAWRQTHSSKDGAIGTYTVTYTP